MSAVDVETVEPEELGDLYRPITLDDVDERHARLMKATQHLRLRSAAVAMVLADAGCDVAEVTDVLEDVLLALELATGQLDLRCDELVPQLDLAVDEDNDDEGERTAAAVRQSVPTGSAVP